MAGWIPFNQEDKVANPLPVAGTLVWIFDEFYSGVTLGVYTHNGNPARGWWVKWTGSDDVGVTHWAELEHPEPPA